ncbi:hypothetical protein L596_009333 [Steinernema carpocapsae]|uniref:CUB domain-containing protein n=1 Tax=Steinernema carpocapsae TaxID=34508 RepID=A0A4U5PFU4_STECR|nr:hypothetical protein L596_009333 [Steinernema carpocapsae]
MRTSPPKPFALLLLIFFLCNSEFIRTANSTSTATGKPGNGRKGVDKNSIPICALEALDTPPNQVAKHVAALPTLGQSTTLSLLPPRGNFSSLAKSKDLQCVLQLETCVNCLLSVQYTPPRAFLSDLDSKLISKCDENSSHEACFNLEFLEPKGDHLGGVRRLYDYHMKTSIWEQLGRSTVNSTTSAITIRLFLKNVDLQPKLENYLEALFPIRISVYENVELIVGSSRSSQNESSIGFIQSPRFPDAYPRNILKNYTIVNRNPEGFVRLVFDDCNMHFQSELRILDSSYRELFNSRQEYRRPPSFVSTNDRIFVIFASHDFSSPIGFRAKYEFVDEREWLDQPTHTDCDKHFDNYGGTISMGRYDDLIHTHVDCVFLVGNVGSPATSFDHVYLKVEEFHMQGVGMQLEVRDGPTSTSEKVLVLIDAQSRSQLGLKQPSTGFSTRDHMSPTFYVRIKGYMTSTSGLSIVYSQYYRWSTALCPGNGEFHCDNARCIKTILRCDTINHCGDGSDEVCAMPDDVYDHSADNEIAGIITVVIGACLLLLLILLLLAILTRVYRNKLVFRLRREVSHLRRTPQTEAEISAGPTMQTVGDRRFYVLPENQISVIEAPPTYDDALKHPSVLTGYPTPAYTNPSYSQTPSEDAPSSSQGPEGLPAYSSRASPPSPPSAPPPATARRKRNAQQKTQTEATSLQGSTSPQPIPESTTESSTADTAAKDSESWV